MHHWDNKILLSITGIDIFSAMLLISTEIVDVRRFSTPWKLVSYAAGLDPQYKRIVRKNKNRWNNKTRLTTMVKMMDTCPMRTYRYKI